MGGEGVPQCHALASGRSGPKRRSPHSDSRIPLIRAMQSCHHDRRYRKLIWRRLGDKADWATRGKESVRGGLAWSAIVLSGFIFFGQLSPFLRPVPRRVCRRTLS